ncbi:MAG: citrate synthase [Bryobacteraceae bacterium]|nr:citrate synthase [Bryobacteraceae bacterium]
MSECLKISDERTGQQYEAPIKDEAIRAIDLRKIKTGPEDFGLLSYDPAFLNTASCRSAITYIDGDKGILRYRGYSIDELAEKCSFLEVAWLLLNGELPTEQELTLWQTQVKRHTMLHESTKKFLEGFRYDAHPMGMLISTVAALSTVYPEARNIFDAKNRRLQMTRLIAKMPTICAYCYRHHFGLPYIYPDVELSFTGNFMNMMWKMFEPKYVANPILERALDVLFILHADHEQNCSTNTMRGVGSAHTDPYLCVTAAASALAGALHGGANEEVLRMLDEIGTKDRIPSYIEEVKSGKRKLMGFGHRVYKNYDPRAEIIKRTAYQVFTVTGENHKIEMARELERIALEDDYFVQRKLYPNVDFYSGIIYEAMGFRPDLFTVLFAIPRVVGWLAQWEEMLLDSEQKIARPRQIYTGHELRQVVPMHRRGDQTGVPVARDPQVAV